MASDRLDDTGYGPARALLQLVHEHRGHMSVRQRVDGFRSVVVRAHWKRRRPWFAVRTVIVAATLGVLAFVGVKALDRHATALSYAIEDGHVDRAGSIEGSPASQPRLKFSDGTEVLLSAGSKASLRSVDDQGARMTFADGGAHVDVIHRPGARWLFEAGPFLINVTGTAFSVAWRAGEEQLDVHMERGSVAVTGPLTDGPIVLRSGQHLIVRVHQRETLIRDLEEPTNPGPVTSSTGPTGPRPADPPVVISQVPIRARRSGASPRATVGVTTAHDEDWANELANGDFEAIVRQAESRGVDACLAEGTSRDLASLGDAARYARRDDIARRVLLTERRRFPQSDAARDAAFLLGRMDEAQQSRSGALDWYEKYLSEAPNGTYSSEALGRRMILVQQLIGNERGREIAQDYAMRFPQGAYAERARALVRGH
ncbi:MAG: FecR domain-containing protein [Myxococcota bacterium]|nr:FecR domain-containing protein [Myxococcota bacterium]